MRGIEDGDVAALDTLETLYPHTGKAHIIGITGAPGSGKSTLVDALVAAFRAKGVPVGVVAVDPTSPLSGGAILGDRVRMQQHSTDTGVFIRSVATRGWLGGLARAALGIIHVMDAMGKHVIFVETVGIGQQEVDVTRLADTSLFVLTPGSGDAIQMMKAGILEVADIFVINKSDQSGATRLKSDLEAMLHMSESVPPERQPPILFTEALSGKGIDELVTRISRHRESVIAHGEKEQRERQRARLELSEIIEGSLRDYATSLVDRASQSSLLDDLVSRNTTPRAAASKVLEALIRPDGHGTPPGDS